MKINGKMTRILAMVLTFAAALALLVPVGAVEPRVTSNGYTQTNVTYNGKDYIISLGVGISSSYVVTTGAYCKAAPIVIDMGAITADYDTISYGNQPGYSSPITRATTESVPYVTSDEAKCPYGSAQVIKVTSVFGGALFYGVNYGSNVTLYVTHKD